MPKWGEPGDVGRVDRVALRGEVVEGDFGRHGEHPGASMSVAWMPIGKACQQPASTVSDVRRSQRTNA